MDEIVTASDNIPCDTAPSKGAVNRAFPHSSTSSSLSTSNAEDEEEGEGTDDDSYSEDDDDDNASETDVDGCNDYVERDVDLDDDDMAPVYQVDLDDCS